MTCKAGTKLVYGVGFNSGKYPAYTAKKHTKEYKLWNGMLERCYSPIYYSRHTYENCSVSETFKHYSNFYEWCQTQIGFGNRDSNGKSWCLDKDFLVKGNRLYSEDTCLFLPHKINCLISSVKSARGLSLIGTHLVKKSGRYESYANLDGVRTSLGYYDTSLEAFSVYKAAKEAYIKQVAEQYKDVIDPRAYKALLEYEVNIDD